MKRSAWSKFRACRGVPGFKVENIESHLRQVSTILFGGDGNSCLGLSFQHLKLAHRFCYVLLGFTVLWKFDGVCLGATCGYLQECFKSDLIWEPRR